MPWSFVHINDTQPGSPRSFRYRPAYFENEATAYAQIRRLSPPPPPEVIVVGGDLTRDGFLHDFELHEAKARLDALSIPYRAIPGNMDVGNKATRVPGPKPDRDDIGCNVRSDRFAAFESVFGAVPWTFVHRDVRFTGFYEALAGSGLPEEQRMWDFLESLAKEPPAQHHVVVNHYALFIDRPDEPTFDIRDQPHYLDWYFGIDQPHRARIIALLKRAGVRHVLSGHIHCRRPVQIFDGIRYYKTAGVAFSQWTNRWPDGDGTLGFYRFDVDGAELRPTFIPLDRASTRTDGYGLGGHVREHQRDYTQAWGEGRWLG